ncbi:MAG: carboxypeptidase-like regulatory domain-containing protein [Candidatus Acidiferrales bacterium]
MKARAAAIFICVLLAAGCALAQDQDQGKGKNKGPQLRTVAGQVVDKDENPIAEAIIYLENMSTKSVQSHISDDQGNYNYSGLDPNVDYQIYAEREGMTSSTHTISSFDSRTSVNLELKVDRKKPDK